MPKLIVPRCIGACLAALACTLCALCAVPAPGDAPAKRSTAETRREVAITVYNQDFGLVRATLGPEVIPITPPEFVKIHESIDVKVAEKEAQEHWISQAKETLEPTRKYAISTTVAAGPR